MFNEISYFFYEKSRTKRILQPWNPKRGQCTDSHYVIWALVKTIVSFL